MRRPRKRSTGAERSARTPSGSPKASRPIRPEHAPSRKQRLWCSVCRKPNGDLTAKPGGGRPWLGCWSCEAAGLRGGDYVRALATELGILPSDLLDDLASHLAPFFIGAAHSRVPAEPLPSAAMLVGHSERLWATPAHVAYLLERRGLSKRVVQEAGIGSDGRRLLFPIYRRDKLVNVKRRFPRDGAQMRAWPGLHAVDGAFPLYLEPGDDESVVVCEGELDALRLRSAGVPAVAVTLGAGTWRDEWTSVLEGRRVAVCFDVGAEASARRVVERLRSAGISARRLDLRGLGLRRHGADVSDYLNGGGSARALRRQGRRAT